MIITRSMLVAWALVAAAAAIGAVAYVELPAGAVIATHFDVNGQANGFMTKGWGLVVIPLIAAVVVVALTLLPQVYPNPERMERSKGPYGLVVASVAGVLLVSECAIAAKALRPDFDVLRIVFFAVAVMLAVIGNVLGKLRQNRIIGIRTRWALGDEGVWDKTHRFTGRAMVVGALVLLAFVVLGPSGAPLVGAVILCAVGPVLLGGGYSWWLWRNGPGTISRQV